MTIATTDNRVNYVGDGIITQFSFTFKAIDDAHIFPYLDDVVQSTGFTVTRNVDQEASPGGVVDFAVAPGDSVLVTLERIVPNTQETDYTEYDPFPAETHETALDMATMRDQQLDDKVKRSVQLPVSSEKENLAIPEPSAGKTIIGKADESGWEDGPTADEISTSQTYAESAATSMAAAADSAAEAALSAASIDFSLTWTSPLQIGSGLSIPTTDAALTALNGIDIAYVDSAADELRTYRWNGANWAQVGSGLSLGSVNTPALTTLNETDVAYIDAAADELRTYRWNGSTWAQIGSGLSVPITGAGLTALNGTDVAFIDSTNDELRTYRWNGSTWAQIGSGLSIATVGSPALTALNETDVAFIDENNRELRTYRWNGFTWAQIGSGLSISAGFGDLTTLNGTDIAYDDSNSDDLRTYRWNGSTWAQIGSGLSIATAGIPALTTLNGTDVAYIDANNDELRTYRFGFSL
jgi:hypothetical protein